MKCLELSFLILFLLCVNNVKSDSLNHFIRVSNAFVPSPKERWGEIVDKTKCADECLKRTSCLSFEMESGKCFLSEFAPSDYYALKYKSQNDFYKRFYPSEEYIPIKHATITHETNLGRKKNQTFDECQESCRLHPRCHSFEIKLMCTNCKLYRCILGSEKYPEQQISPNYFLWSVYLWNPNYNQSCDKSMEYAKVELFDGNLDPVVMYECFQEENQTASGKNGKWIEPAVYCPQSPLKHFVVLQNISLAAPKERWGEIVDNYTCANECLKRNNCHSFEIESGECFLSEYLISDDHKPIWKRGRDFYQRIDHYNKSCGIPAPTKPSKLNLFNTELDSMSSYKCFRNENVPEKASKEDGSQVKRALACTDQFHETCEKIKKCSPISENGIFQIYPTTLKGKSVSVFCDGMSTNFPNEYIRLLNPTYFEVPLIKNMESCPNFGANGRRRYNKVRFLPEEMVLDLNDQTFTTFDSLPPSEEMCFSKQNITVDLRGTDLTFGERVNWVTSGDSAIITSFQILKDDQLAIISCRGDCGICKSISPFPVTLFERIG